MRFLFNLLTWIPDIIFNALKLNLFLNNNVWLKLYRAKFELVL